MKVRTGKNLSGMFPIYNSLKKIGTHCFSALQEYAIIKAKKTRRD
jgi:hypothetical protein